MERKVDELGRVVLPKEMRKQLNIQEGDTYDIEIIEDGDTNQKNILLSLKNNRCIFCGSDNELKKFGDKKSSYVCKGCINKLKD